MTLFVVVLEPKSRLAHVLQVQAFLISRIAAPIDMHSWDLDSLPLFLQLGRVQTTPRAACFRDGQCAAAADENGETEEGWRERVLRLMRQDQGGKKCCALGEANAPVKRALFFDDLLDHFHGLAMRIRAYAGVIPSLVRLAVEYVLDTCQPFYQFAILRKSPEAVITFSSRGFIFPLVKLKLVQATKCSLKGT